MSREGVKWRRTTIPSNILARKLQAGAVRTFPRASHSQCSGLQHTDDVAPLRRAEKDAMLAAFGATRGSGYENAVPKQALASALGDKLLPNKAQDDASSEPQFSLGRVQYTPPSDIKALQVQNNILVLVTDSAIVIIDLATPSQEETLPPPWRSPQGQQQQPPKADQLRLFLDPQALHAILSVHTTADNYYIPLKPPANSKGKQLKPLPKLKGLNLTAVSFTTSSSFTKVTPTDASCSGDVLLATDEGKMIHTLFEAQESRATLPFKSNERFSHTLSLSLTDEPITGVRHFLWDRHICLLVTTANQLHQFVAKASSLNQDPFDALQRAFADGRMLPKTLELAGEDAVTTNSQLMFARCSAGQPQDVAWFADAGVYYGTLTFASQQSGDGVIDHAQLYPYPQITSSSNDISTLTPRFMALTPYHMMFVYSDTLRISRILDDRIVYEEVLQFSPNERQPLGIIADAAQSTYWIYSSKAIYELSVNVEDRDIWQIHLRRNMFEQALQYAKTPKQKDVIQRAQADSLMSQGRMIQAADLYAQTAKSFEEVVLLLSADQDALRNYLAAKLDSLSKSDLSARMALATWLLATYLAKLNTLEDALFSESDQEQKQNLQVEVEMIDADVRAFLKNFRNELDKRTTLELIRTHGRSDIFLEYARIIEDHSLMVEHYMDEEDWSNALKTLAVTSNLELYYRYAHELLCYAPAETVEQFQRRPQLDATRLLPSLLLPSHPEANQSIKRYLQWLITRGNKEPTIHNTLLALHLADGTELPFLESEDAGYDLEHALRLCLSAKRTQACAVIYGKMNMYESAVDLALDVGDLEIAKTYADRAIDQDDEFLRRKLWKKIAAKLVAEKHDIQEAMKFLETDALKIEDILPFFPDFVLIDSFKDDICDALETYASRIEELKSEMNDATNSASTIKRDIAELSHRLVVVDSSDKCSVCQNHLLKRQFYVFPCTHAFHADCLVNEVTQHLSASQLKRVIRLQERLSQFTQSAATTTTPGPPSATANGNESDGSRLLRSLPFSRNKLATASLQSVDQLRKLVLPDALVGAIGAGFEGLKIWSEQAEQGVSTQEAEELEKARTALDDILASSCVWCDRGIAAIDHGFLQEGERDD